MAKKVKKQEERISNIPQKQNTENVLTFKNDMTVQDVANGLNIQTGELVKKLMMQGIMANVNKVLDRETIELIALDYGFELKNEVVTDTTRFDEFEIVDDEKQLVKRPPVVTIMGHVDHGKTTLLDNIRNTRVVSQEAGGITQHIGAYQINRNGSVITFIDTPGHAAFTEMRARGAKVTDITILVVAADDGVMPQTEEAIAHAKAANVPIIVAVNKVDKPHANPEKVMQELSNYDLIPEAWGGKTIFVNISALTGQGIDNLLDVIELVAEMENLRANPNRLATGTVIEARLDKGNGPTATFIIQNGTLKTGDNVVVGKTYGKIRTMRDDTKLKHDFVLPSMAVEVTGLAEVPQAGDKFMAVFDEKEAKKIADERTALFNDLASSKPVSLEDMFARIKEGQLKDLNLIIKGDTQGSIEALKGSINKLNIEGIRVCIINCSVGTITNSDVILARASNAIIIGFNVRPMASVRDEASNQGVEIRLYNIIYQVLDDIEQAMKGMLDPVFEEVVTGQAEVRSVFKNSKVGTIAGCYVTNGNIERNSLVRILRNGVVIYEGKMASLKRFKDDVKEVRQGYECGITIENYNDIKELDVIEASIMKEKERS